MTALRIAIVFFALLNASWMAFDGIHALTTGDYVTPSEGRYAGQLGPWSKLVEAVGIEPRSALMKWIFTVYGSAWLVIIVAFIMRRRWATGAMLGAAIGSLWYLMPGTIFSAIQIVLLALLARRTGRPT